MGTGNTFADGDKYEGYYKDGDYNGLGTYKFSNGKIKKGLWKDGEFYYSIDF